MTRSQAVQPIEVSSEDFRKAFGNPAPAPIKEAGAVPMAPEAPLIGPLAPPRDEVKVLQKIGALAQAAGEDWFYRFPVKRRIRDGGGQEATDYIEGPSIKCANTVARLFGNCMVQARLYAENESSWVFLGRFVDRETGYVLERAFQQSKRRATIRTADEGRAAEIAFQIGQSKTIRNVICNALEIFTNRAFEDAKAAIVERISKKPDETRAWLIARLAELGVDPARAAFAHARPIEKWTPADMALIYAEIAAIRDGWASADETWPAPEPPVDKAAAPEPAPEPQRQETPAAAAVPEAPHPDSTAAHDGAPQPADTAAPAEDAATAPVPDKAWAMPYRAPPAFWAKEFRAAIESIAAIGDLALLMHANDQALRFVERVAPAVHKEIMESAAKRRAALGG